MIARLNDAEWPRRQPDGLLLIATAAGCFAKQEPGRLLATPNTAINQAIATQGSGPRPIGDTADTLTGGCC